MIISHKYKFIFVKTIKTAGTSIEVFLSQLCGDADIVTPVSGNEPGHVARNWSGFWNPFPEMLATGRCFSVLKRLAKRKKFYNHIPARAIRSLVPKNIWDEYHKFCVERNPYDKTLSDYHMVNQQRGGRMTLEQYFKRGKFPVNFQIYTDDRGNQLVDKVVRYESLTTDLGRIFDQLKIPFDGSLGVNAKGHFRKNRARYQDLYTDDQRKTVRNVFAAEIEMHGYMFDVAAQQSLPDSVEPP